MIFCCELYKVIFDDPLGPSRALGGQNKVSEKIFTYFILFIHHYKQACQIPKTNKVSIAARY